MKVGSKVRAFVPGTLGVVKQGQIVKIGWKYVHVDFGLLGIRRVPFRDIVTEET